MSRFFVSMPFALLFGLSACTKDDAKTKLDPGEVTVFPGIAIYGVELQACDALVPGYLSEDKALRDEIESRDDANIPDIVIPLDAKEAERVGLPVLKESDVWKTWRHHIRLVDGTVLVMDKRPSPEALDAIEAGCREFPKQMQVLARYPSYFLEYVVCQALVPEFEMFETRPGVFMIPGTLVTIEETEAGAIGLPTGEAARPAEGGWHEIAMSEGNEMVGDNPASAAAASYFEAYCRRKGHGYYSPNPFGRLVLEE